MEDERAFTSIVGNNIIFAKMAPALKPSVTPEGQFGEIIDVAGNIAGLLMDNLDFLDVSFKAESCGVVVLLGR